MKTILEFLQKKKIEKAIADSDYEAVDLGLSVKWCACNVGATKPEDPGLLFQWGRTDGYKYDDKNHKFLSEKDYVTTSGVEYQEGDVLNPKDDAAYINMGNKWRMPTLKEIKELCKLKHKWTELNGVKGYEFIGTNGNSIFIPIGGFFNGLNNSFKRLGSTGGIWASAVTPNILFAHYISLGPGSCSPNFYSRYAGFSVRGVCK